jgi:hypothetical protein
MSAGACCGLRASVPPWPRRTRVRRRRRDAALPATDLACRHRRWRRLRPAERDGLTPPGQPFVNRMPGAAGLARAEDGPPFLAGSGEMGERIRAHDWSMTPLGPPEAWPASLRTVVAMMLRNPEPVYVALGAGAGLALQRRVHPVHRGAAASRRPRPPVRRGVAPLREGPPAGRPEGPRRREPSVRPARSAAGRGGHHYALVRADLDPAPRRPRRACRLPGLGARTARADGYRGRDRRDRVALPVDHRQHRPGDLARRAVGLHLLVQQALLRRDRRRPGHGPRMGLAASPSTRPRRQGHGGTARAHRERRALGGHLSDALPRRRVPLVPEPRSRSATSTARW